MAVQVVNGGSIEWNDIPFIKFVNGETERAMNEAAITVQATAKKLIGGRGQGLIYVKSVSKRHQKIRRTKSGRLDRRFKQRITRRYHQASAPGDPPARDTGILANSVSFSVKRKGLKYIGQVGPDINDIKLANPRTDPDYGYYLEVGTRNMLPRPWLKPALIKSQPKITKIFKRMTKKVK